MAQITNADLKRQIDELSRVFTERLEKVEKRVDMLEKQALPLLERIDAFFAVLKKFLKFMRWLGGIITVALASQAAVWIVQHLAGR